MGETVEYDIVGSCILLAHNTCAPSDREFAAFVDWSNDAAQKLGPDSRPGCLAFTDGAAPTAKQRMMLATRFTGNLRNAPTTVLSLSALVRGAVTAISWAGRPIKAFEPLHVDDAFDYLRAPTDALRPVALKRLLEMRFNLCGRSGAPNESESHALLSKPISKLRNAV